MNSALVWHGEDDILGVRVRVHLFDVVAADASSDSVARLLPVFTGPAPIREGADGPRTAFAAGELRALPDAVFAHGPGLICLSHGGSDTRLRDRDNWRRLFRVDAMLQSLATAMAVAGERQRPTAAMLREHGALYHFDPGSAVLECLATHIGAARRYWGEAASVSPDQLASFCEPRLRAMPGVRETAPRSALAA